MYYYLDPEDGYSKGPYTWDDLKHLALPPETHIYNQPLHEWRTLAGYQQQMAAEARQAVRPAPRLRRAEAQPEPAEALPSAWQRERPKAQPGPYMPHPGQNRPQASPQPAQTRHRQKPAPRPAPTAPPVPWEGPMQTGLPDANPMGISGVGCFIMALLVGLAMAAVIWWLR